MQPIVEKAKKVFLDNVKANGSDPYTHENHVFEVERWAKKLLKTNPTADEEVLLLSVWLHDFGVYPINPNEDHAITGERKAKEFLSKENYDKDKTEKVLHCIRSHRCKDVMPKTLEAKMLATSDSASHFTSTMYFDILYRQKKIHHDYSAFDKINRDYRDIAFFLEVKKELTPIYEAWVNLLKTYEKIEY